MRASFSNLVTSEIVMRQVEAITTFHPFVSAAEATRLAIINCTHVLLQGSLIHQKPSVHDDIAICLPLAAQPH